MTLFLLPSCQPAFFHRGRLFATIWTWNSFFRQLPALYVLSVGMIVFSWLMVVSLQPESVWHLFFPSCPGHPAEQSTSQSVLWPGAAAAVMAAGPYPWPATKLAGQWVCGNHSDDCMSPSLSPPLCVCVCLCMLDVTDWDFWWPQTMLIFYLMFLNIYTF